MAGRFMRAPHVRSVVHGDRAVLLDLRRERYYSLDDVGTRVWALVGEGADVEAIIAQLVDEFDAPADRVAADVDTFLKRLVNEMQVVVPVRPPASPVEPSSLTCAVTLAAVTLALRATGLRRSLVAARWFFRHRTETTAPSADLLASVVRKIATAAAFFPGRALCLEQSLTLYVCLRRSGVPAELRIGAQPYPFAAHAWVECRGEPVGTSPDQVNTFVPFERLLEAV